MMYERMTEVTIRLTAAAIVVAVVYILVPAYAGLPIIIGALIGSFWSMGKSSGTRR